MDDICEKLQTTSLHDSTSYKKVMYLDCDPKVFGLSKYPIVLDYTPSTPYVPKVKVKRTKLERMCEEPQTKGEEAVKIYVEYCREKGLPISVDDINGCLAMD